MYDAKEIAKYIIYICNLNNISMTVSKLCKILYYAQGIMLTRANRQLFFNDIVAWKYGPCVPDVYYEYAHHGAENIYIHGLTLGQLPNFSKEEKRLILYIIMNTKDIDFCSMIKSTTKTNSLWSKVELNAIISPELIKQYFTWF